MQMITGFSEFLFIGFQMLSQAYYAHDHGDLIRAVAEVGTAKEDRQLVADEAATAMGQDGRPG
jgi:hypothetical protein